MALDIRSSSPPNTPIHALTFFRGAFSTIPSNEECDLSAWRVIEMIAPEDGPRLVEDKSNAPYFVLCPLKVAPFVGKTAERFPGKSGKQRSAAHLTEGSAFANDLDGLTPAQWERIVEHMVAAGVMFCAYSTHSHGKAPDEVRARVLLFMDRALDPVRWADVWHVLNGLYFDGLADPATAKLSQQAGVWMAHPDRVQLAFRIAMRGALLSADALLSLVPPKPERTKFAAPVAPVGDQSARYAEALALVGAEHYADWLAGLCALKGAVMLGHLSDEDGAALWWRFTDTASAEAQEKNDDSRFDPESMWARWMPSAAPPDALVGKLFARARDKAMALVRGEMAQGGELSAAGLSAAQYLAAYHRRAFEELRGVPA
ncbi:hypothetical protein [Aromatoleum bremense]|uniref:Uncharacterized protein n=1 Tax=Aromatoleum bremense TaxID=76115 RepID=A0ABX1NY78_9RHOO|nr:hypothetical protein [Aromatoleum bremense]NMG16743.1 hypothetical protein [Aromatoleum bremense]